MANSFFSLFLWQSSLLEYYAQSSQPVLTLGQSANFYVVSGNAKFIFDFAPHSAHPSREGQVPRYANIHILFA